MEWTVAGRSPSGVSGGLRVRVRVWGVCETEGGGGIEATQRRRKRKKSGNGKIMGGQRIWRPRYMEKVRVTIQ
jgi:hypothetical protein